MDVWAKSVFFPLTILACRILMLLCFGELAVPDVDLNAATVAEENLLLYR